MSADDRHETAPDQPLAGHVGTAFHPPAEFSRPVKCSGHYSAIAPTRAAPCRDGMTRALRHDDSLG
jgi:hypothetical protein